MDLYDEYVLSYTRLCISYLSVADNVNKLHLNAIMCLILSNVPIVLPDPFSKWFYNNK